VENMTPDKNEHRQTYKTLSVIRIKESTNPSKRTRNACYIKCTDFWHTVQFSKSGRRLRTRVPLPGGKSASACEASQTHRSGESVPAGPLRTTSGRSRSG
jgi:hypothetical protein